MEENEKNFKTVQNPNTYKDVYKNENTSSKTKIGFGKGVLLPFLSGIVGCSVVLRHMFRSTFYPLSNF